MLAVVNLWCSPVCVCFRGRANNGVLRCPVGTVVRMVLCRYNTNPGSTTLSSCVGCPAGRRVCSGVLALTLVLLLASRGYAAPTPPPLWLRRPELVTNPSAQLRTCCRLFLCATRSLSSIIDHSHPFDARWWWHFSTCGDFPVCVFSWCAPMVVWFVAVCVVAVVCMFLAQI